MKRIPLISLSVIVLTLSSILLATVGSSAKQRKALSAAPVRTSSNSPGVPPPAGATVYAVQNGPWNVGITGTPTFNLNNSDASPLFVRDVDHVEREPFQVIRSVRAGQAGCGLNFCTFDLGAVPAGKALIITNFHGEMVAQTNQTPGSIDLQAGASPPYPKVFSVPRDNLVCANDPISGNPSRCPFNQALHLRIGPGETLRIDAYLLGTFASSAQLFVVNGYYVDASVAASPTQQRITTLDEPGGDTRREIMNP